MANRDFKVSISSLPVEDVEAGFRPSDAHGADIRFHGVVRGLEDGRPISGIDYSCYETMALAELERICEEMRAGNAPHLFTAHHRIGFVTAGEASIIIRLQTPHSAAAFDLCREYLHRIKTRVPIWKRPVFYDPATEKNPAAP